MKRVTARIFTKADHLIESEEMDLDELQGAMQTGTLRVTHAYNSKIEFWIPVGSIDHLEVAEV